MASGDIVRVGGSIFENYVPLSYMGTHSTTAAANTFVTVINFSGIGFFEALMVLAANTNQRSQLKLTLDGNLIANLILNTAPSAAPLLAQFIGTKDWLFDHGTSGNIGIKGPLASAAYYIASFANNQALYGDPMTTQLAKDLMLLPFPLKFKTSLKLEIANNSTNVGVNYELHGGKLA